jgi:hypothetical protein
MSKGKYQNAKKNGAQPDKTNSADIVSSNPDKMFADGKISLSKYIAAKKQIILSGSYKLDAPVIVDGEEIVISAGNKPLLIEAAFNPAFSVINKGKLTLSNIELRMPPEMIVVKEPLQFNILGNELKIPFLGSSKKRHTALIAAENASIVELHHSVIEGASDCGIMLDQSEFLSEDSEINHCRTMGLVLKNSSASLKKCTVAENGTRGLINAQVWIEKSAAIIDKCTVRTSRGGDGVSLRDNSRAEIRGGSISGNIGNGLSLYDSSSTDVADCKIVENGVTGKTYDQIYLDKSSAVIRNCTVSESRGGSGIALNESRAEVESCAVRHNNNKGFSVKNSSTVKIRDCAIKDNATKGKVDAQIYIEKSAAVIEKCSINDASGNGVTMKKGSSADISDCAIKNNTGNAISAYELSKANVKDCRISGNGTKKKVYAQIFLDHAVLDVRNCEITDCVGGPGIALFKDSEISVSSCVICRNGDNGITACKSPRVEVRDCTMMWNGSVGYVYVHIYLEMATAVIERCHLYENYYGYAVYIHGKKRTFKDNSVCDVTIRDCLFEKNKLGLRVDNPSKLRMSGSKIANNVEGDTMFEKGSILTIEDEAGPAKQ